MRIDIVNAYSLTSSQKRFIASRRSRRHSNDVVLSLSQRHQQYLLNIASTHVLLDVVLISRICHRSFIVVVWINSNDRHSYFQRLFIFMHLDEVSCSTLILLHSYVCMFILDLSIDISLSSRERDLFRKRWAIVTNFLWIFFRETCVYDIVTLLRLAWFQKVQRDSNIYWRRTISQLGLASTLGSLLSTIAYLVKWTSCILAFNSITLLITYDIHIAFRNKQIKRMMRRRDKEWLVDLISSSSSRERDEIDAKSTSDANMIEIKEKLSGHQHE